MSQQRKPPPNSFRLTIAGERWRIVRGAPPPRLLAAYGFPARSQGLVVRPLRTIWVTPNRNARWTLLHEIEHALHPMLSEPEIEAAEAAHRRAAASYFRRRI